MERDELIRFVVNEVERQLAPRSAAAAAAATTLALVEPGPRVSGVLAGLRGRPEVAVVLVSRAAKDLAAATFPGALPDDPDRLESEVLPGIQTLLLPCLRPASSARIALGLDSGTVPRLTAAALWAGKRVVAAPGWLPEAGMPAYRAVFAAHLERLRSFGVILEGEASPAAAAVRLWERKLLTEADVIGLRASGVTRLTLPAGALVTSLAMDAVHRTGLQLERR